MWIFHFIISKIVRNYNLYYLSKYWVTPYNLSKYQAFPQDFIKNAVFKSVGTYPIPRIWITMAQQPIFIIEHIIKTFWT